MKRIFCFVFRIKICIVKLPRGCAGIDKSTPYILWPSLDERTEDKIIVHPNMQTLT
mgnify:CR=1 FL=1